MLDWKCLLGRHMQSALVGQAGVDLGSGLGGGHIPYKKPLGGGKKKDIYSNLLCLENSICPS